MTRPGLWAAALIGTLTLSLVGAPAVVAGSATTAGPMVKVIVNFRGTRHVTPVVARNTVQAAGGEVRRSFQLINSVAAVMPAGEVGQLRANPAVKSVEPDYPVSIAPVSADASATATTASTGDAELDAAWGVEHIGAGDVHAAGITGQGIKIGVIDTGIDYTHPDLDSVYAGGWDFYNNDPDPFDDNGHGTHVSGILAAELNDPPAGVVGVAPGAKLYAYKVLGADGSGDYSGMIAALERADLVDHVDVVNMSLGGTEASDALAAAVQAVYADGVIMVAAAGNVDMTNIWQILFGCPVVYPARYPEVFATTYTNPDDALTGFSCTGPEVDFAAPGDLIYSTVPTGTCMFCDPSGYRGDLSGTSMASPHLAGTVALVLSYGISNGGDPATLADDVKAHLCATTTLGFGVLTTPIPPTDPRYPEYFGCGVVNAANALLTNPPPSGGGPTNHPPLANDDSTTTEQGTPVTVEVLANDSDPDGDALMVSSVTQPTNGSATYGASDVTYAPNAGFSGSDAFTYTVSDGNGGQATATVRVTVTAPSGPTMHVGDLANLSTVQTRTWTAKVRIRVLDGNGARLASVVVTGTFSNGKTKSCTTGRKGQCSVSVAKLSKSLASVTFTVSGLTRSGWTYVAADNADPDGDSDGTTIVLLRP
jgi:subtilisin